MPLNAPDCPLLKPESALPGLWSEVDRVVGSATKELAAALDVEQVQKASKLVAEAEALLRRERYRVGFVGPSQLGKSTTLNRIARTELANAGGGGPATNLVSRFLPVAVGVPARYTLRYMTLMEFQQRRWGLANALKDSIDCPVPEPEKEGNALRAECEKLLRRIAALAPKKIAESAQPDEGSVPDPRGDDRATLIRLLKAFHTHGARYVSAQPTTVSKELNPSKPFSEQLYRYTNHSATEEGDSNDLLWQIQVEFPTETVSPTIELIDLPGLGTTRVADDLTTLAFMDELDGALVFMQARQAKEGSVGLVLSALHGERDTRWPFGKAREPLRGRIWTVITYVDPLSKEQLGLAGNSGETVLDHLAKTLNGFEIKHGRAVFVGNVFHKALLEKAAKGEPITAETYQGRLGLDTDASGKPLIPPLFDRHPELKASYQHVLGDGGIDRLRQVVGVELAEEVRRLVCRHVCRSLVDAANGLCRHIVSVRQAGAFGPKQFVAAREWANVATLLAGDREPGEEQDPVYRELATESIRLFNDVKKAIRAEFAKIAKRKLGNDLRDMHAGDAMHLIGQGKEKVSAAVNELFEWTIKRFATLSIDIEPINFDGAGNPADALKAQLKEDLESPAWAVSHFQTLEDQIFFPSDKGGADGRPLTFEDYLRIIRSKIDEVTHEACHRAVGKLKARLHDIRDRMAFVSKKDNLAKMSVDPALLDKAAADLKAAAEKLTKEAEALIVRA